MTFTLEQAAAIFLLGFLVGGLFGGWIVYAAAQRAIDYAERMR